MGSGSRAGASLMKKADFIKLAKGDIVKNTYHHEVIKPNGGNEFGVVLEPPKKDDNYPQVLVWSRGGGKNYWHMAVVELVK